MTKKTRFIIVIACVACFFVIAPVLVAYSMGYRFDLEKMEIVETGGIYVRTFPSAEQIMVDYKFSAKPGIFSNAIFIQSLLPKDYTVLVEKAGYFDYLKTIPVREKEVTKLENVTLFKKDMSFVEISDSINYFSVAPNNEKVITVSSSQALNYFNVNSPKQLQKTPISESIQVLDIKWSGNSDYALVRAQNAKGISYYFFDSVAKTPSASRLSYLDQNSQLINFNPQDPLELFYLEDQILYSLSGNKPATLIKDLVTYTIYGNNILWLSFDGKLLESDDLGKLQNTLSLDAININAGINYKIENISGDIFLHAGNSLFLFDYDKRIFIPFALPEGNYKILNSPDNKNIIFWNNSKIYVYSKADKKYGELLSEYDITNCQWVNNNYVVITSGDSIIISEIDYRGQINQINLPSGIVNITAPETFYIQQSGKIYILTNNTLLESEKLTP